MLSIHSMDSQMTNKRIKTAGYRRAICRLIVKESYRNATDTFNRNYHRIGTDAELSYGTLAGDIEQEGFLLISAKQQTARRILQEFGFDPDTGKYAGATFPEEYKNDVCQMITIDPNQCMVGITPGWHKEEMDPNTLASEEIGTDEECLIDQSKSNPGTDKNSDDTAQLLQENDVSQPDTEEFQVVKKRRGKRDETPAEKKLGTAVGYIQWYNSVVKHEYYGIIHPVSIEQNSRDVVYISIDAVYVDQQVQKRRKPGSQLSQPDTNTLNVINNNADCNHSDAKGEKKKRIGHMNIKIESGFSYYFISSIQTDEAFKEMVAVIMKNALYKKYLIFMTDGEVAINDKIKEYCHMWKYHVELDWIHLEHKCYDRLSNALKGKRVPDPRGNIEYYKRGPKKGQIKSQDYTAQSRLYARAISRILWVGNVNEAIHFLEHIDSNAVHDPSEIDQLITYLKNKIDWIPCYSLRRKTGLKNSSNGVEGQNNMNVAERQKNNEASWRPDGSSALTAIQTLIDNKEDEAWFYRNTITFSMVEKSN